MLATSSGSTKRFKHCPSRMVCSSSGVSQRSIWRFVLTKPGTTQLIRMFLGPKVRAPQSGFSKHTYPEPFVAEQFSDG